MSLVALAGRTIRRSIAAAATGLLLAAPCSAFAAAGGGALSNPVAGNKAAIAAGRTLYQQHCVLCHGKSGGRGPDLFENTLTDQEFYTTVVSGRSGARGEMPAWAGILSGNQVWEIEAFVKSRPHL